MGNYELKGSCWRYSGFFWDNRVLELVELEAGMFSISCHFKNCEDGFRWTFIEVYGPTLRRDRECFLDELGAIKGLWSDLGVLLGILTQLDVVKSIAGKGV